MVLLGSMVNGAAIVVGGGIGLLVKKGIPERVSVSVMNALALTVFLIGIQGALQGENIMIAILSMVLGTLLGEGFDLDGKVHGLGRRLDSQFNSGSVEGQPSLSEGFVAATLLVCVGAMAIVGSLQSGLSGDHATLFAKSLIDGIAALILASSLGMGVLLAGATVLLYEGSITLFASALAPLLTQNVINEMTCVGSLLIIGLSLNMLKVTDLKIMNYTPAVFLPLLLSLFM